MKYSSQLDRLTGTGLEYVNDTDICIVYSTEVTFVTVYAVLIYNVTSNYQSSVAC